ncbi:MAG TPA: hypothetical protein VF827_04625, partial [Syntrophales bacterium]
TGPPFFPLDDPDIIGLGSGMRRSSVLTSEIRVAIVSPFPEVRGPSPIEAGGASVRSLQAVSATS